MKDNKGFTLVELLAVIVILAIIIIIAIPSVMTVMNTAKEKLFVEYNQKLYTNIEKKVLEDKMLGKFDNLSIGSTTVTNDDGTKETKSYLQIFYDIQNDLELDNTGNYYGSIAYTKVGTDEYYYFQVYSGKSYYWWCTKNGFYPNNYSDFVKINIDTPYEDYKNIDAYYIEDYSEMKSMFESYGLETCDGTNNCGKISLTISVGNDGALGVYYIGNL